MKGANRSAKRAGQTRKLKCAGGRHTSRKTKKVL